MVAIIEDKREAVAALCRRHNVVRLDVFGSVLRNDFRPGESDIDFLADFGDMDPGELVDAYFDLLDELRALFDTEVDLVMVGAIKNPYVLADVERTKRMLYAA